jgi:hypothetical protein
LHSQGVINTILGRYGYGRIRHFYDILKKGNIETARSPRCCEIEQCIPDTVKDGQPLRAAKVGFPMEDYVLVLPGFYELMHVFMQADIIKNPFELAIRNNGRKKTNQEY